MKVIAIIAFGVAGCVGAAALLLKSSGLHMDFADPIAAAAASAIAAMIGSLPILLTRETDSASIIQRALIGTVVHAIVTIAMAAILVAVHIEQLRGAFIYWMLGAYWASLAVLVSQLRLVMLRLIGNAANNPASHVPNNTKVQN